MSQRVTLEAIARHTGVSLATVSLVLRDKPGINDETRRRVLGAARELGYRRRPGQEPRTGRAIGQIGVITKARAGDQPQANPFHTPTRASIEAACRRRQINLLVASVPVDMDNHPEALPRMLIEDRLEGIILVGAFVDQTIDQLLRRRGVAAVLADAYATSRDYDAVVSDNFRGAYEAVAHLIAHGHRQIAMVGTLPAAYPSIAERRRGYEQCLADHGLARRYYADARLVPAEAAGALERLLRQHPEVTALFCANDSIAIEALTVARALGRRIPEELSLVGFDDIELAAYVTPALTTMHVDKLSLGRLAVQLLADRIENPEAATIAAVLRPALVPRASVAAAPEARA